MGPGPSPVEPRVYEAIAKPIVGHLDPYFFEVVSDIHELLRKTFGTRNEFTMVISGTGSAGMEAAVTNFVEAGTKFAVLANGYFCDRITEMARRQEARVVRLEKPWGEAFEDTEAREFILREKPDVVAWVQAETSTGVYQQGRAIGEAAHEIDALVIADCVTSLGAVPVLVDDNEIDIAYSCTQKGLSCPPGLAPITVSARAMERLRARKTVNHSWYLDLKLLDLEPGYARLELPFHREITHSGGVVQGGIITTLADSSIAHAAIAALEPAAFLTTTIELKINFIRPAVGGVFRCEARLIHLGRRTAVGEAEITNERGKLVAKCLSSLLIQTASQAAPGAGGNVEGS